MGRGGGTLNKEIRANFATTFACLGINKPQLLVWYLLSRGEGMVKEILELRQEERDKKVSQLVIQLNNEYGRNKPIQ